MEFCITAPTPSNECASHKALMNGLWSQTRLLLTITGWMEAQMIMSGMTRILASAVTMSPIVPLCHNIPSCANRNIRWHNPAISLVVDNRYWPRIGRHLLDCYRVCNMSAGCDDLAGLLFRGPVTRYYPIITRLHPKHANSQTNVANFILFPF